MVHKTSSVAGIPAYAQKDRERAWRLFQMAYDQRGDTAAVVFPDGRIPKRQSYSDYGSQSSLPSLPYGFLGSQRRLHFPQTGLDLLGARFYDPELGRFLRKDPIPGGSANAYDYEPLLSPPKPPNPQPWFPSPGRGSEGPSVGDARGYRDVLPDLVKIGKKLLAFRMGYQFHPYVGYLELRHGEKVDFGEVFTAPRGVD